jgi:hypothetical protein
MGAIAAARIDGWLAELGLNPVDRGERDGITSWDLLLDGRRRADIRFTLILDPARVLLCWVHYAPPVNDSFRVSYRQFLRWNDELPHVKFALSGDEDRPMLTSEVATEGLTLDVVGLAVARLLAVCDLLLDESIRWLWPGAKKPPPMGRASRQAALFVRYAEGLEELLGGSEAASGEPVEAAGDRSMT